MRVHDQRNSLTDEQERDELLALLLEEEGLVLPQEKITVQQRGNEIPLSLAQQRLWFLEQWMPHNTAYLMSGQVRLKGTLHREALQKSLQAIVERHESLRTSFTITAEGDPIQVIAPSLLLPLAYHDLESIAPEEHERAFSHLARTQAQQPFDLTRPPLLRVSLVRMSACEHILLLTVHHIIFDGWSVDIFVREMAALYTAFVTGQPALLPALPIQYADFSIWQRQWTQSHEFERLLEYWKRQLDAAPEMLELPADHPRPATTTFQGFRSLTRLPPPLVRQLKTFCQQCEATPFMVLLASFLILLARYSSQEDVLVGTLIANRTRQELEGLLGFFVNMLPLRVRVESNMSGKRLIERVRETCLDGYTHQEMPFEYLVEILRPKRSLSHQPLVQVTFQLRNVSSIEVELPGLTLSLGEQPVETARFDLSMDVVEENDTTLLVGITYRKDLFEEATIQRMAGHYRRILEELVSHPEQKLGRLPLLTQEEYQHIVVDWNRGQRPLAPPLCLHELVSRQVALTPDAPALLFRNTRFTYKQLEQRANQLAHLLRSSGIGPDCPVAVCLERSPELIVSILAILKAGGTYVPLDPDSPPGKLDFLLARSQAELVITQQELSGRLKIDQKCLLMLDHPEVQAHIARQSLEAPAVMIEPEHLAYMIYTSGSTGEPKGVMIPHRGISNRLLCVQEILHLTDRDRVLQKTPISFDVSVGEIFLPLITGACLVIAEPRRHWDTTYLMHIIQEQEVSYVHFVPSMLRAFLETPGVEACKKYVRYIWSGGEALSPDLAQECKRRLNGTLINGYGPTEASVGVTAWVYEEGNDVLTLPIGRPLEHVRIYILDAQLNPVPVGIPGEIYIGGLPLARGYYQHPEWTAERFIPDPFSATGGERLYRTGDRGQYRPDGLIEFLGRDDNQVKIRGLRIELGEIETILRQQPGVRQGIVRAREGKTGEKQLVAYVVPDPDQRPSSWELRQHMAEKLVYQMVPSVVLFLEALPLSTNGKVDLSALPEPEMHEQEQHNSFVVPTTELERSLARIWQELLHVEKVSIDQNFFELGGHSLLLIKMQSRLESVLGYRVPVLDLFQHPTIRSLAKYLRQMPDHTDERDANERGQMQREAIVRQQQRMRARRKTV
jgi:amino acid adenylation domain-containing protein